MVYPVLYVHFCVYTLEYRVSGLGLWFSLVGVGFGFRV